MKTCLCCGASCAPDALSCPACGEASWGGVVRRTSALVLPIEKIEFTIGDRKIESEDLAPPASALSSASVSEDEPETPNNAATLVAPLPADPPILTDPPTIPDAPKGRRSARRS